VLRCVSMCCSVLHYTCDKIPCAKNIVLSTILSPTCCNAVQNTATHCNAQEYSPCKTDDSLNNPKCNILQHTATHCNTLQHTATHYNTLQRTATHYNTLQHNDPNATYCIALQHITATHRHILRVKLIIFHPDCNTLQHTVTRCNTRNTQEYSPL